MSLQFIRVACRPSRRAGFTEGFGVGAATYFLEVADELTEADFQSRGNEGTDTIPALLAGDIAGRLRVVRASRGVKGR
jgi:hypothetical protein